MSAISPNLSIPQINLSEEEKKEFSDYTERMQEILKRFNDVKGEAEPVYMGLYTCAITDAASYDKIVSTETSRFIHMYESASSDAAIHLGTFIKVTVKVKSAIQSLIEQRDDFFKQENLGKPKIDYKDLVVSWQERLIHLKEIVHAIFDRSEKAANAVDYLRAIENKERIKVLGLWVKPYYRTQRYYTATLLTQLAAGNTISTPHFENKAESKTSLEQETPLKSLLATKKELFDQLSLFNSVRNDAVVAAQIVPKILPSDEKEKFSVNSRTLSYKIESKLESKLSNLNSGRLYDWVKGIKEAEKHVKTLGNNQFEYQETLIELSITTEALSSLIIRCEIAAKAVERLQSAHWSQYAWFDRIVLSNEMTRDNVDTTPNRAYTASMLAEITAKLASTNS